MTSLSFQTIQPHILFAAKKKSAQVKSAKTLEVLKPPTIYLPIYTITTSNGDGSYRTNYFANKPERDKALAWLEKNDDELPCDAADTLELRDIYQTADAFIQERTS
jgi:hypothetical protein